VPTSSWHGIRKQGGADLEHREIAMLGWAFTFLVIALIAAALGFGGVAGAATGIAKILFFVFLVAFVLSFFVGRTRRLRAQ
jgi:uncharacterized membrane protein YtjA (UPF0391 family)